VYSRRVHTGAEVDDEVCEKDCIGDAVEDDPVNTEVVVEERNGDWKHDEIRQQKNEHEHIPVKSEHAVDID